MKTKLSKIMGIGFALVLVASMLLLAIPAAAGPYANLVATPSNKWVSYNPTPALPGGWFFDPTITKVGPIAEGIDGDLYAYVQRDPDGPGGSGYTHDIFKSTDGGRTWSVSTIPAYYPGGAVVDMVCSSLSEDVLYLTDGNYVYKSVNGGLSFMLVAPDSLEFELKGCCGTLIDDFPITSIDLTYDGGNEPVVFIGTRSTGDVYLAPHPDEGKPIVGSVYWISDERFPAEWADLQLRCYGACCDITSGTGIGCYDVFSVAAAPDFAVTNKAYALISKPYTLEFSLTTATTFTLTAPAGVPVDISWTAPGPTPTAGTITDPNAATNSSGSITIAGGASVTFVSSGTIDPAVKVAVTVTSGYLASVTAGAGGTVCNANTQVVSTVGTICSWAFVSELCWNCDAVNSFQIRHGSRFAFPDDFTDTRTMFIGVAGTYPAGPGGDVYAVSETVPATAVALDLNVQGYSSGCLGRYHANICSLDIMGGTNDGALIAGALDDFEAQYGTDVFYSTDGGWSWDDSDKDPTGYDETYVLWYGQSALATTRFCDCAVSMSCGDEVGKYWNQIALINTCIDQVEDLSHAPGYLDGGSDMFVLTSCDDCCWRGEMAGNSLFRWDGTYWERVFSSLSHEYAIEIMALDSLIDWVEVSPDYNDTDCLYLANTSFDMFRSVDRGCSWRILSFPCMPRPYISAWIVVDEETVLVSGASPAPTGWTASAGKVFRTMRHGTRPWDMYSVLTCAGAPASNGVDFDLSLPRGATSDVLLGDADGQVYISYDLGETWAEIEDAVTGSFALTYDQTYVVFDPGYGVSGDPGQNTIYAAGGTSVGRCAIDSAALMCKQDWVYICPGASTCDICGVCLASGIDAVGDTALYVADAGNPESISASVTVEGTIEVECVTCTIGTCGGDFDIPATAVTTTGPTAFINGELVQIVAHNLVCTTDCVDGDPDVCTFTISGEIDFVGLSSGAVGFITVTDLVPTTYHCTDCVCPGGATCTSNAVIISGHLQITSTPGTTACSTGVWRTLNPMDPMMPAARVEWQFLELGATPTHSLQHPVASSGFMIYPDDLWLTAGSNVLWALDRGTGYHATVWMWDDPLATPVIQISPANGALLPTTSSVTLEWEKLDGASAYEVYIYSYCAACPDNMVPFDDFVTTLTCIVVDGLTPGTTYYWKVRVACDSPVLSKWSTLRSFDTALGAVPYLCSPICGAEDVILTTNFSWDAVGGATSYELQIVAAGADGTADWTGAATLTTDVNAMASIPGLEYSTVYYWRVRAVSDGVYSAWSVCLFTTMAEPVEPPAPTPPVEIVTEEITPTWIWVIIGIGAALVICVIILIVTTRRVP